MDEPVDQGARHDLVAEDLAPLVEALVRGQHGGRAFVAATHELEEEHRAGPTDREIADLVDDQETGEDERLQAVTEATRLLRLLERRDQVGERAVVDASSALRRGDGETDGETDGEVALAHVGRPQEDHVLVALEEAERVEALDLL